jgi:dehydrogenase/reductase SDR family member 7
MLSSLHAQRIGSRVGLDYKNSKITNIAKLTRNSLRIQQTRYSSTPRHQRRQNKIQVNALSIPFLPMVEVSLPTVAICAGIGFVLFNVIRFAKAYADLTLLSKRRVPRNAFQDKVVWIVGASQGLGEALTLHFAAAGARLILSSRSLDKLEAVKATCLEHISAENIVLLPLDLTGPPEALDQAAENAFSAFNSAGVDYVVHNAGASQHAAAEDTSHEVATALIKLNLLGPINLAKATLPLMLQRGSGRQVVVASMSAVVPSPGQAVYAAAKSGLRAYFSSITSELADTGVGATVCCPGPLATGNDGKPRVVYGANGLIQQANTGMSKKRVHATRAAELIAAAAYYKLDEAWIAFHPVLLMGYLMQYMPSLGMKVLKKIGPGRVALLKDGSGMGYDVAAMLKKKKRTST